MPVPRVSKIGERPRRSVRDRAWLEWCFLRVCFRHFRKRFIIMAIVLLVGGTLFMTLEDQRDLGFLEAVYFTFSLIFGEPPEDFPKSRVLQSLFFIVPVLGLTIIIEGIVDFSIILQNRRRFERGWCTMLSASYHDHIVLVGLGRLGFRIFDTLRRLGESVVVIERDPQCQFLEDVRRDGTPLFIGDARREALLDDANIKSARSIILATNDDMANLEAALDARKCNPEIRVVLRMFDQNMADKVAEGFNIHLAMSESALSAPTFATSALAPATVNSMLVGDQLVSTQRWLVRQHGPFVGLTIAEMMREFRVTVIEHVRGEERTICPLPEAQMEAGDGLLIQGPVRTLQKLRKKTDRVAVGK